MIDAARVGGSTPSYTHALAVLGQYCNQQHARSITLAQVDTGFLLHFFSKGQWRKPISIDIHNADLLELTGVVAGTTSDRNGVLFRGGDNLDRKHPLLPMGYEAVLRAVGIKLDRRRAVSVTICDTGQHLYVNYWVDKATFLIRDGRRQAVSNTQLEIYDTAGIQHMLKEANEDFARESSRYEHSMRINQYDHITALAAAFLFESDGKYRDAEALYGRIAAQVPRHPEAHYHVARMALTRGERRAALAAVRKAIEIVPDEAAPHDLHGRVLRQGNKLKEAVAAFERAVALDEENGIYHYHLALAYEAQGRSDEAMVQMALSTGQELAPAWEMVQEEIAAEHVALIATPATRPERQPSPQPAAAEPAALGVSANVAGAASSWETEPALAEENRDPAGVPLPKLTTFDEEGLPEDWIDAPAASDESQALLKPMTLEQRLRAAGALPTAQAANPIPPSPPASVLTPVSEDWSFAAAPLISTDPSGDLRIEPPTAGELQALGAFPAAASELPAFATRASPLDQAAHRREPEEPLPGLAARTAPVASHPVPPAPKPVYPSQPSSVPAGSSNTVELATEILQIQRALEGEPNRADLHRKLGFLLARQGKTAEAAMEFRKALQASRTNL
ncbi:MAG TPA: tetratricopeptide repeat protein [Chloroflexota bacterium]|nr:tetratricopeptide repeat protein [Chloroflexota bacterium]